MCLLLHHTRGLSYVQFSLPLKISNLLSIFQNFPHFSSLSYLISPTIHIYIYIIHADLVMDQEKSSRAQSKEKQKPNMKREAVSNASVGRREKLRRLRLEMSGQVHIPDTWGQETRLQDWADCPTFTVAYAPAGLEAARTALAEEAHTAAKCNVD